jgi:hypothetical protein
MSRFALVIAGLLIFACGDNNDDDDRQFLSFACVNDTPGALACTFYEGIYPYSTSAETLCAGLTRQDNCPSGCVGRCIFDGEFGNSIVELYYSPLDLTQAQMRCDALPGSVFFACASEAQ